MKKAEFKNVFEGLCDYYNRAEDKGNLTIIEIYFDQLKYYDIEEWELIQKELLKNCKMMPKISEIEVTARKVIKELKEEKQRSMRTCKICGNTGFVLIKVNNDGEIKEYAAACSCAFGDKTSKYAKRYSEIFPEGGIND